MIPDSCLHQRIQHLLAVLVNLAIIMLHHAPESFSVIVGRVAHKVKIGSQHQSWRLIGLLCFRLVFCFS